MPVATPNRAKIAVTSFLLFCTSLLLIGYSARNPRVAGVGSTLLREVVGPLEILSKNVFRGVSGFWDDYLALYDAKQELKSVQERLVTLEGENSRLLELESENKRLREVLQMSRDTSLPGITAEVVGYDPSNWIKAISINRGTSDGVQVGMAVLDGKGVVGQVIVAGSHVSRVLLITDHGSGVDAIVQSSRVRGLVAGDEDDLCALRFVPREEDIKVGDRVITSGMDGIFPKGLFIGIVSDVEAKAEGLFRSVSLKPAVDFSRIESVFVVNTPIVPHSDSLKK